MFDVRRSPVRHLLAVLVGLLCLANTMTTRASTALSGGRALTTVSVVLDWIPNSDHAGLYLAMRQGIFRRHGLEVTAHVPSDTTAQIRLVAAGRADFGFSYEADLLAARAQHIPVRSVMCVMQHPLNTVMVLRSSGITRPKQLEGRTIGVAGSPSDVPILAAMMRRDHASVRRAHILNVGYNLLPALLARRVDAVIGVYWTWEAIQAKQRGYPVNVMRVERWGVPNYCELVLVASEATIRNRPQRVRAMVQSLQLGYARAEGAPEEAWRALATVDPTLKRPRNHSLIVQSVDLLRGAILAGSTVGEQNPGQWEAYARWIEKTGIMSKSVSAEQAFTNQFLSPHVR